MAFFFENLYVYKKALDFAERIDNLCTGLPKVTRHLSNQLRRASVSTSLNIAERTVDGTKRKEETSSILQEVLLLNASLFWS